MNKNDGINLGSEYKFNFEGDLLKGFLINIGKIFLIILLIIIKLFEFKAWKMSKKK